MANDGNQAPAVGGGLLVVLAVLAGLLLGENGPISSLRPLGQPGASVATEEGRVPARLWQDPFAAVLAGTPAQPQGSTGISVRIDGRQMQIGAAGRGAADFSALFRGSGLAGSAKAVDVLAVMLPTSMYGAQVEWRLRMRYAVLTALAVENYMPADAEHLRFLRPGAEGLPRILPYEWHVSRDHARPPVLLLWLDQAAFTERPLHALAELRRHLEDGLKGNEGLPALKWTLIGPADSTALQAMVRERVDDDNWQALAGLRVHSPFATISSAQLNALVPDDFRERFRRHGVRFSRTIADDGQMAGLLVKELRMRGIEPQCEAEEAMACAEHVVLISEFDTRYGRALPEAFVRAVGGGQAGQIHVYHYLRGVDGRLPEERGDDEGDPVERPNGRSQADYLRRLAADLQELDRQIRAQHPLAFRAGIRAIGILGSDVYDKLMVLQAIRPRFPDAAFFTTDLDAAMLHPGQWPWTRNLIVASSYGLRLGREWQGGAPPFRSVYQTAAFLAVRQALGRSLPQPQRPSGMVFEIGRGQAVPLLNEGGGWLYPPVHDRVASGRAMLALGFAALLAAFVWAWCRAYRVRFWARRGYATAVLGAFALALLLPSVDDAEPNSWLLGVSIWPTEAIRLFVILFMLHALRHVRETLRHNAERLQTLLLGRQDRAARLWRDYLEGAERTLPRIGLPALLYLGAGALLLFLTGIPQIPYRGSWAQAVDATLFVVVVLVYTALAAHVLDAAWYCRGFLIRLQETLQPQALAGRLSLAQQDGIRLDFHLVAERTEAIGRLIHYPMVALLLMTAACVRFFDNWYFPLGLIALVAGTFVLIAGCFVILRRTGQAMRQRFLDALAERRQGWSGAEKALWDEIDGLRRGAFRPLASQPWVHALALFLGGGGSMVYMQLIALMD